MSHEQGPFEDESNVEIKLGIEALELEANMRFVARLDIDQVATLNGVLMDFLERYPSDEKTGRILRSITFIRES